MPYEYVFLYLIYISLMVCNVLALRIIRIEYTLFTAMVFVLEQ